MKIELGADHEEKIRLSEVWVCRLVRAILLSSVGVEEELESQHCFIGWPKVTP